MKSRNSYFESRFQKCTRRVPSLDKIGQRGQKLRSSIKMPRLFSIDFFRHMADEPFFQSVIQRKRFLKPAFVLSVFLFGIGVNPVYASLHLEMIATPNPVRPGEQLRYLITVSNQNSNTQLDNVRVEFPVPQGIGFFTSASQPDASGCGNSFCQVSETAAWNLGSLAGGENRLIIVDASVGGGVASGTLISANANGTHSTLITPVTAETTIAVSSAPSVRIEMAATPNPVVPGGEIEFVIDVGNRSNATVSDVEVRARIPVGTTLISSSVGGIEDVNTGEMVWNTGSLPSGDRNQHRFIVQTNVNLDDGDIISGLATLRHDGAAGVAGEAETTTMIQNQPQLQLSIIAGPDSVRPGEQLRFFMTVSNITANTQLDNVTVELPVPVNTGFFTSASQPNATGCGNSFCQVSETAVWNLGSLAAGESRLVVVDASVGGGAENGALITANATARSTDFATPAAAEATVVVANDPPVRIEMSATPSPVVPGDEIEFVIDVGNRSNATVSGVEVRARIPVGTTLISSSVGGIEDVNTGEMVWNTGSLPSGDRNQHRFIVQTNVNLDDGDIISGLATLRHDGAAGVAGEAETTTMIQNQPQLQLSIIAGPDSVRPGEQLRFFMTVSNITANTQLDNVTVELPVPVNTGFFTSASQPNATGCGNSFCQVSETAVWNLGSLAAGESRLVVVDASVGGGAENGALITANATARSTDFATPVAAEATVVVANDPPVRIEMSATPSPVVPGDEIEFVIDVGNRSNATVSGVEVRARIPEGTTLVSASAGGSEDINTGEVVWSTGSLPSGDRNQHRFIVQTNVNLDDGDIISGLATLRHDGAAGVAGEAETTTMIQNQPQLQLTLIAGPDSVRPGEQLRFFMTVSNITANTQLDNVTVELPVPVNTGFFTSASQPNATGCGNSFCQVSETAVWNLGSLAAGESRLVVVDASVGGGAESGALITANATARSTDFATPAAAEATVVVGNDPPVRIEMSATPSPVVPGDEIEFVIDVGNRSNATVSDVEVRARIPVGTTLISSSVGGIEDINTGEVVWNTGSLPSGDRNQHRFIVQTNANLDDGDIISGLATLRHDGAAGVAGEAETTTMIQNQPQLQLSIIAGPDSVRPGEQLRFFMTVSNITANTQLDNVTVELPVPVNTGFFTSASQPNATGCGNSFCQVSETAVWNLGSLAAGESRLVVVDASVGGGAESGALITANATARSTDFATPAAAEATVVVGNDPPVRIEMSATPSPVMPGDEIEFVIDVGNRSSATVSGVEVRARIPEGTTLVSASAGGSEDNNTGEVVWNTGSLPAGVALNHKFVVRTDLGLINGDIILGIASLRHNEATGLAGEAETSTLIQATSLLEMTVSATPNPVLPDNQINYAITVKNVTANRQLDNVNVALPVPTGTGFFTTASQPNATGCGNSFCQVSETAIWNLGPLGAGESQTISLNATVAAALPHGTLITANFVARYTDLPAPTSAEVTVVVGDSDIPQPLVCPVDMTVDSTSDAGAVVNYNEPNVPGATVACNPPSGSTFPIGTTTVECTATDAAGNVSRCTFDVIVNDATAPEITCPADITTDSTSDAGAVVNYNEPNVAGATVACNPPSGSTFPIGTTTVECTATDAAGNVGRCTFDVTVNDATAPEITCPADITTDSTSDAGAVVNYNEPNVAGATVACNPPSGSTFPIGTTTVECTATDAAGNVGRCTFDVIVNDATAPEITCPADITTDSTSDAGAVVNYNEPNVPGATVACNPPSGSTFPIGTTTVECTATDAAGNVGRCTFDVIVNDATAPEITCPADITTDSTSDAGAVVNYNEPNVAGATVACNPPSGSTFPIGTTTVECTATDAAGNVGRCTFDVIVNDATAPEITCPADITTDSTSDADAVVNYNEPNVAGATVACNPPSGSTFPIGTTTVECTAKDAAGNVGRCTFDVIVNDATAPEITCPADITTDSTSDAGAVVNYNEPNVPGATVACNPPSGSTFPIGTTTVECTAKDAAGNVGRCTFDVIVNDATAPEITCPADITTDSTSDAGAVVNYNEPNVPGATVACNPPSGSTFPIGTTTVECTATDAAGNVSRCTFDVIVNDATAPEITCPADITTDSTSDAGAVVNYNEPNVPGATVACNPPSGSTFPIGVTEVTCTATDAAGNVGRCTFNVIVNDVNAPEITCPAGITVDATSDAGAVVNYNEPNNVPGATVVCDPPSGSTFPIGTTTVECTATDAAGNIGRCTLDVIVNPINHAPIADAGSDINVDVGMPAAVDGSASSDSDGDFLIFSWRFISVPPLSAITDADLSGANTPMAQFTPDVAGDYELELEVFDGEFADTDTVVVRADDINVAPNADAGTDHNVEVGQSVTLDGTGSNDPDNGPLPLTFEWTFDSLPLGSTLTDASISNANQALASFTPDVPGDFVVILEVFDGDSASMDAVTIAASPANVPPNADAGDDQMVNVGVLVTFDGSGSNDPDDGPDPLSFSWSFVSTPANSSLVDADIANATTDTPSFTPDVEGTYLLRLDISDGEDSDFDQVMVEVVRAGSAPSTPENLFVRIKRSHLNLFWGSSEGATNYRVFRRLNTEIDFVEVGQTVYLVFVDDLPQEANSAEYFVMAENGFGLSDDSAIVMVTMNPRRRR